MNNFNQEPEGWPECEEFYNLMQHYRHVSQKVYVGEEEIVKSYEAVKKWLRKEHFGLHAQLALAVAIIQREGNRNDELNKMKDELASLKVNLCSE